MKYDVPFGFPWGKLSPQATDEGLYKAEHRTMLCRLPASPHPALTRHLPQRGRLGRGGSEPPPYGVKMCGAQYLCKPVGAIHESSAFAAIFAGLSC